MFWGLSAAARFVWALRMELAQDPPAAGLLHSGAAPPRVTSCPLFPGDVLPFKTVRGHQGQGRLPASLACLFVHWVALKEGEAPQKP